MRMRILLATIVAIAVPGIAHADSQSSNTSSNSSSNNGVVRERVVDTYCEDGYCQRYVSRRVYRDDRRARRYRDYYGRYWDYDRRRYRDRYYDDDD